MGSGSQDYDRDHIGKPVCIPITVFHAPATKWPFTFQRRSVGLYYAMTINKCQGQTLQKVGVYLPKPMFSHGQFNLCCDLKGNIKGRAPSASARWIWQGNYLNKKHSVLCGPWPSISVLSYMPYKLFAYT